MWTFWFWKHSVSLYLSEVFVFLSSSFLSSRKITFILIVCEWNISCYCVGWTYVYIWVRTTIVSPLTNQGVFYKIINSYVYYTMQSGCQFSQKQFWILVIVIIVQRMVQYANHTLLRNVYLFSYTIYNTLGWVWVNREHPHQHAGTNPIGVAFPGILVGSNPLIFLVKIIRVCFF